MNNLESYILKKEVFINKYEIRFIRLLPLERGEMGIASPLKKTKNYYYKKLANPGKPLFLVEVKILKTSGNENTKKSLDSEIRYKILKLVCTRKTKILRIDGSVKIAEQRISKN